MINVPLYIKKIAAKGNNSYKNLSFYCAPLSKWLFTYIEQLVWPRPLLSPQNYGPCRYITLHPLPQPFLSSVYYPSAPWFSHTADSHSLSSTPQKWACPLPPHTENGLLFLPWWFGQLGLYGNWVFLVKKKYQNKFTNFSFQSTCFYFSYKFH